MYQKVVLLYIHTENLQENEQIYKTTGDTQSVVCLQEAQKRGIVHKQESQPRALMKETKTTCYRRQGPRQENRDTHTHTHTHTHTERLFQTKKCCAPSGTGNYRKPNPEREGEGIARESIVKICRTEAQPASPHTRTLAAVHPQMSQSVEPAILD